MEPIWLGLAAPSLISTAENLGHTALSPFSAVLKLASGALDKQSNEPSNNATLTDDKNPHTSLLSELLTGRPQGKDGAIEIADIRTHADTLRDSLLRRFHDVLQNSGISLDEPVQLRVSPTDGQLEVVGDHAQRAMVEAALASDPGLAADFRQLTAMHSLISAADKHHGFAEAYARDPYQAVNDFAELFDGVDDSQLEATLYDDELRFAQDSFSA